MSTIASATMKAPTRMPPTSRTGVPSSGGSPPSRGGRRLGRLERDLGLGGEGGQGSLGRFGIGCDRRRRPGRAGSGGVCCLGLGLRGSVRCLLLSAADVGFGISGGFVVGRRVKARRRRLRRIGVGGLHPLSSVFRLLCGRPGLFGLRCRGRGVGGLSGVAGIRLLVSHGSRTLRDCGSTMRALQPGLICAVPDTSVRFFIVRRSSLHSSAARDVRRQSPRAPSTAPSVSSLSATRTSTGEDSPPAISASVSGVRTGQILHGVWRAA